MSFLRASDPRPRLPPVGEATALFNDALSHRAELAAIELAEARRHAQASALWLALAGILSLLGGFAVTLTVAGVVWDSPHRAWWLAGLCAAYLAGAGLAGLVLRRRLQTWRPLAETRHQLQQDHQCLMRLVQSITP